jgi:hypothetical protein
MLGNRIERQALLGTFVVTTPSGVLLAGDHIQALLLRSEILDGRLLLVAASGGRKEV